MAVEPGWYYEWFADGWFPPVWFAPADDEHLVPAERATTGGPITRGKGIKRPKWIEPTLFAIPLPKRVDEVEAMILCGAI